MPIRFGRDIRLDENYSDEWYTPLKYAESARKVLGSIDLDPASCEEANQVIGASRFYMKADDGLSKPWRGNVWLNPPYSDARLWVAKMVSDFENGRVQGILLVNAWTESKWFQPIYNFPTCFHRSRIKFWRPGTKPGGMLSSSVLVYFGHNTRLFASEFYKYGPILTRYRFK